MEAWIDRLATALGEEPLAPEEVEDLLAAAREVAHGVERRVTPLTTFLAGVAVGRAGGAGDRGTRLAEALAIVRRSVAEEASGPEA